jgi:hypothetical protein
MKKIILLLALALPVALSAQDTIIRSFAATCTFQNFVLTPSGRYSGTLLVNDQTNTYRGDSVKVNDLVYAPSATLYVIDTVSSKNRFTATVIIRRISGKNAAPTGVGDVFRPTPNYKFYGFTPDNQNGLPSQAQFIKLTGIINRLDSLIYAVASASGGVMDGDKGDIIISSGGGVYTIDSLAVTKGKIAAAAVDSTKIGTSAIATSNISNGAVTNAKVGVGVVTTNPVSSGIGFLPMYAATLDGNDSLTNSIVRQSSSKIGIGITPDSTFTVDGSGRFVSPVAASKFIPSGNVPTGNGMYLPQANNVAFSANGVERLRLSNEITANGLFNVVDSIVPIISLDRSNLPNNQRIKFLTSNSDYSLSAGQVNGSGNYQSQMTIDSSGNVGIGTPFPATRLHVQGQLTVSDLTKSGNSRGIVAYQSDGTIDTLVIGGAIELVNDTLTVKASGIDSNMLASSSVTWVKLAQAVKDSITAGGGGGGGVTSITAGTGLTGGTITTSGTIAADTNFLVTVNDTASMLLPYLRDADTTAMLAPYLREADTLTLSNRINLKVNISDTTAMLLPYLRKVVDSLSFVTTYEGVAVSGEIIWNNQSGTVHLGMAGDIEMPIGQAEAHMVRNTTGSQIAKGKVVYISGASGQRPLISLADADSESTSSGTFGITAEAIDNNDTGFVFVSGYIHGINTDTISPGSALWLDTIAGGFTTSKPVAPIHAVLVGYSITQANNGTIFVKVQNGYELGELHDVNVSGAVNGNLLRYNSSLSIWEDAQADSASIATSAIKTVHIADSAVTSVKLASASVGLNTATTSGILPVSKGGTGLTTFGGAGRVPYSTGTTGTGLQFDTTFFVDPTNGNFIWGGGARDGSDNINIGTSAIALRSNNGTGNINIGANTGIYLNSTGIYNVSVGYNAGINLTTGDENVSIGIGAGSELTSGSKNTYIGPAAGRFNASGSNNIAIGADIYSPTNGANKTLTIGNLIFGVSMDSTGTAIPVNGKVGILNNNPSTALDVSGAITATAFQPLILRRNLSTNTSQLQQLFQLKNASDAYVNYGAIASEIVSNTAGKQIGNMRFSVIDSSDNGTLVNRLILGGNGLSAIGKDLNTSAARTLDVFGEMRIRDLITDTPTRIVGADADGDLGQLIIGTGLSLVGDTLTSTGGSGVADGDKGDIDVTSSGTVWTIDNGAVTGAKIASSTITGDKLAITGISGDAAHLVGAISGGNADTVRVGSGLQLSSGELRADTMAMIIACSDEKTNLDTATAAVTFRAPFAFTVLGVRANVNTAPVGAAIEVDINETGVSILSQRITIDASEKTSLEAGTAPVISDSTIANDAEVTIDIDQVGTTTKGKGLKVTILYRKN